MATLQRVNKKGKKEYSDNLAGFIMSSPAIILLVAFLIIPIIYTIYYSFFTYQVVRPDNIKFNAIGNYVKLFHDENFYVALKNTVYFTVIVVPVQCTLALVLALMVSSKKKGVAIFRTLYYSPQITSMVIIAVLWTILYNSNANTGLINTIKYVLMITLIQAMKLFTQPYIMTKGGPRSATKTLVFYIYEQGFQKGNFGYACSIATVFFIIVVALSIIVKKISKTN